MNKKTYCHFGKILVFMILLVWLLLFLVLISHIVLASEVSHKETEVDLATFVQVEYVVEKQDTLDGIVDSYILKNTYGAREHKEFKEGIYELNPWLLSKGIKSGDKLYINYWKTKDIRF